MNYHTHNTHAHLFVQTLFLFLHTISVTGHLLAAGASRVTDSTLQFSLPLATAFLLFIKLWCMDDKISWLGGWASHWCPLQISALFKAQHLYTLSLSLEAILLLYSQFQLVAFDELHKTHAGPRKLIRGFEVLRLNMASYIQVHIKDYGILMSRFW
jgi:hypothetical protein